MISISIIEKLKEVILLNCYDQRFNVVRRENWNHGIWARVLETAVWLADVDKYNTSDVKC